MYKFLVLAATLAYASAGLIAHHAPLVAHSAVVAPETYHRSVQSQTIVDPGTVKTVYEAAPIVHAAPVVHAAPIVHAQHVVPVAVSGPEVHKTVQATSIVHGASPVVHHSAPLVHSAPIVHTQHVVPVAVSGPEVHRTVQASSIVHGASPVVHSAQVYHAAPVVQSVHSAHLVHLH